MVHKYCGRFDLGRPGEANKAQKCAACLAAKAHRDKASERSAKARRRDKIAWGLEGGGGGGLSHGLGEGEGLESGAGLLL